MTQDRASIRPEKAPNVPFGFRVSARPGARVEVLGEAFDWASGRPMIEASPGEFVCDVEIPEGVYAWKIKVDGEWRLPEGARTRARGGARNAIASVGGAPEPVLFAAAPPWVVEADRGGLFVVAGLRRGAGGTLAVVWREGDDERTTPMEPWLEEDEHLLFRAFVPASAARVELAIALEDGRRVGREDGRPFVYLRPRASDEPPAWWKQGIVYAIFVDRFRAASDEGWGPDPGRNAPAGGHLEGIRRSLPELEELGVNVLYLTPIHVGASCHRYDLVDPLAIDPALGGEEAFARLMSDLRARGMRVIVDFSFNHAGPGFPPYEDVRAHGRASPYAGWFKWNGDEPACYGRRKDAPLFDLDNADVRRMVTDAAARWAERGVDGLRLDMAAEFPVDLAREVRRILRLSRPDAVVVGELVPAHAWRWRAEAALDAATDFGLHAVATDLFARASIDVPTALARLRVIEVDRGGRNASAMRFLSTHDHARLLTVARAEGNAPRALLALLFLMTWPGVPALLYGEEVGLHAREVDPASVWPDRAPMPWTDDGRDLAFGERVRAVLRARRGSRALREGDVEILRAEPSLLVYRRAAAAETVDVALNLSDTPIEIELADEERPAMEVLATIGEVVLRPPRVSLGAFSAAALGRGPGERASAAKRLRVLEAPRARDVAMVEGALETRAMPQRLFFALSETCTMRCEHCVAHAPEKTKNGDARSLTPRLLDRLRPALGTASYFAFAHGGEPLAAPLFDETLAAIAEERAGAPYVVHVVTNGMLLGGRALERLARAGVSSIGVSLDGASAAVNDAIRAGGRFEHVTANLREAVKARARLGLDVNLGICFVVMRENVAEIGRMVELAKTIGVDWLRLEELVPATPFAKRSLVAYDDRTRYAIARAVARGAELKVAVIDRAKRQPIWRCKLDAESARLLDAEELAARSEIHPCRAPWEDACVGPNGDVFLGDFTGPRLGNLGQAPLEALWNGPEARDARRRAPAARACGEGPVVCLAVEPGVHEGGRAAAT